MSDSIKTKNRNYLPELEGLRGVAALWVLLAHVSLLIAFPKTHILSYGELAVDLFIILSGFLMVHHYIIRQHEEPWVEHNTWIRFLLRRYFRIAPLYYILLFICVVIGPWIGQSRTDLAMVWPHVGSDPARYTDWSLTNIATHVSFVFGAIPFFSHRTPLPDWSIGLEMQFYLIFPFLMLIASAFGHVRVAIATTAGSLLLVWLFPEVFRSFPLPSALPIKLPLFAVGMLVAAGRSAVPMHIAFAWVATFAILQFAVAPGGEPLARCLMIIGFAYLVSDGSLPSIRPFDHLLDFARRILSSRPFTFLGETSYAVYLVHLLFVIPIAAFLASHPGFVEMAHVARLTICTLVVVVPVYGTAWILYVAVERPGIALGRTVCARVSTGGRSALLAVVRSEGRSG